MGSSLFFHCGIVRAGIPGSGTGRVISYIVPVRAGFVKENRTACGNVPGGVRQERGGRLIRIRPAYSRPAASWLYSGVTYPPSKQAKQNAFPP